MSESEPVTLIDIEELEMRVAPLFLGGGHSPVEVVTIWAPVGETFITTLSPPSGAIVNLPLGAGNGVILNHNETLIRDDDE